MECFGPDKRMEKQCADDVIIYSFQLKVFYIVRKCNQPNYTDTHTRFKLITSQNTHPKMLKNFAMIWYWWRFTGAWACSFAHFHIFIVIFTVIFIWLESPSCSQDWRSKIFAWAKIRKAPQILLNFLSFSFLIRTLRFGVRFVQVHLRCV